MSGICQMARAEANTWPTPIEEIYQGLGRRGPGVPCARRRDINVADRLFIGALMQTPRELRPHGIVTWAA